MINMFILLTKQFTITSLYLIFTLFALHCSCTISYGLP